MTALQCPLLVLLLLLHFLCNCNVLVTCHTLNDLPCFPESNIVSTNVTHTFGACNSLKDDNLSVVPTQRNSLCIENHTDSTKPRTVTESSPCHLNDEVKRNTVPIDSVVDAANNGVPAQEYTSKISKAGVHKDDNDNRYHSHTLMNTLLSQTSNGMSVTLAATPLLVLWCASILL